MNAAPDIVAQIRAAGGRIMMVEDRLKVCAPSPLPNELVVEIKQQGRNYGFPAGPEISVGTG